jgi:hypothetical protein
VYPRFLNVPILPALGFATLVLSGGFGMGSPDPQGGARGKIISFAKSTIGIKEATGRNDGKEVEEILKSVGLEKSGAPWCAAYVVWVGDSALGRDRNPYPRSAWSPDFVRNPTWNRGRGRLPTEASTFGVYFQSLKRVGHTGLVEKVSGDFAITIEGNTNNGGSRDGDGVYRRRRLLSSLLAKDWL